MFTFDDYVEKIQTPMICVLSAVVCNTKGWVINAFERVKNYDYNAVALNALILYSVTMSTLQSYGRYLYNNYGIFKNITDNTVYLGRYTIASIYDVEIEPLRTNWICTSMLLKRDTGRYVGKKYSLIENYEFMKAASRECDNNIFIENFKESVICGRSVKLTNRHIVEVLVTMKIGDKYIYSVSSSEPAPIMPNGLGLAGAALKYKFLSIEYTHPTMKSGIVLQLKPNEYYEKNEVLSTAFVKRVLSQQLQPYCFDSQYTLKLMDSNINCFTLKSNEYLILEKMDYKIANSGATIVQEK